MKAVTLRGAMLAAIFASLAFACGTDDRESTDSKTPIARLCPKSLKTRALEKEDMAGKKQVEKTLALTFDSGPSEATEALETYLAQQSIRATFFVNGANVDDDATLKTVLAQASTDGHLLANRTNTDTDVTTLDAAALVDSVTKTDTLITGISPAPAQLYFRPPYGAWNDASQAALAASPMTKYTGPVGWDMGDSLSTDIGSDSECWDNMKTAQECADLFLAQIRSKKTGIVLMHDGPPGIGQTIVDMVKIIVPQLTTDGFKFARLDQLNLVPRSQLVPADDPGADDPGAVDPVTGEPTGDGVQCPAP